MTPLLRGWCPDLFAPMQSGDGWLVRVKPRLGRIAAAEGLLIADWARRFGNGVIELTGRGNLQLRGLTLKSAEAVARAAVAAGLASADPAVERRRNILLSPLAGQGTCALACALECGLAADGSLAALPGKFSFGVDGSGLGLGGVAADIVLRADGDGWRVGEDRHAADDAPAAALLLARNWRDLPRRAASGSAPMAVGWLPAWRAFGFGVRFGQFDAAVLERLCGSSCAHGDGILHLTPWRVVLLSGVAQANVAGLAEAAGSLITQPDDPRRLVSACVGRVGCPQGSVDSRGDALALLAAGVSVDSLHVSGCAKGCAHPSPAAVTLVGSGGRYGLVRQGRAGDTPQSDGHTVADLARLLVAGGRAGGR
ncbi:precorrin-3B synthase [Lichenicoccus sp.]|uniref:precorrin-3B synthase n=1 Tax=Lichenicoccus sp. TaxID=2781899 RepID=UPI003D12ED8A